jgi:anthranilate phosphoribosyltransferase
VLSGAERGAPRTATLMNAAAAIYVSGRASELAEAARAAETSLDSGAALEKLEALRQASLR